MIYSKAGLQEHKLLLSLIQNLLNLIFTIVAAFTSDKFGRKILLVIGAFEMSLTFALTGIFYTIDSIVKYSIIPIWLYVFGFAMSWGPITYIYKI